MTRKGMTELEQGLVMGRLLIPEGMEMLGEIMRDPHQSAGDRIRAFKCIADVCIPRSLVMAPLGAGMAAGVTSNVNWSEALSIAYTIAGIAGGTEDAPAMESENGTVTH